MISLVVIATSRAPSKPLAELTTPSRTTASLSHHDGLIIALELDLSTRSNTECVADVFRDTDLIPIPHLTPQMRLLDTYDTITTRSQTTYTINQTVP